MDYTTLITSEHSSKPKFMALVDATANAIGAMTAVVQSLPASFDLDNAVGVQLDVIGLWVGQPRIISTVLTPGFFGFSDDPAALGMGDQSNPALGGEWFNIGDSPTSSTILPDDIYRQVIRARIARNQSDGSAATLAQSIQDIFGSPASIQDTGTLSINITLSQPLSQLQQALITQEKILPIPAGVTLAEVNFPALQGNAFDTTFASGTLS